MVALMAILPEAARDPRNLVSPAVGPTRSLRPPAPLTRVAWDGDDGPSRPVQATRVSVEQSGSTEAR